MRGEGWVGCSGSPQHKEEPAGRLRRWESKPVLPPVLIASEDAHPTQTRTHAQAGTQSNTHTVNHAKKITQIRIQIKLKIVCLFGAPQKDRAKVKHLMGTKSQRCWTLEHLHLKIGVFVGVAGYFLHHRTIYRPFACRSPISSDKCGSQDTCLLYNRPYVAIEEEIECEGNSARQFAPVHNRAEVYEQSLTAGRVPMLSSSDCNTRCVHH